MFSYRHRVSFEEALTVFGDTLISNPRVREFLAAVSDNRTSQAYQGAAQVWLTSRLSARWETLPQASAIGARLSESV